MAGIEIKVDYGDIPKKLMKGGAGKNLVKNTLLKIGLKAEETAVREAPIKEGTLRASISTHQPDADTVQITGVDYWRYIQYGTAPHTITGSPWLYWKGADHPVHQVNHPGTRANPFVTRTINKVKPQIGQLFDAELQVEGLK